jgi:cation transport regulator
MPYTSITQLPQPIRNSLPKEAQEIFKQAFNHSYEKYSASDEIICFKIAWSAVKKRYEKDGDRWVRRAPRERSQKHTEETGNKPAEEN